ncbi:hypothetical protein AAG570_003476 [Ranatra chinensis]|uniref:Uncharacterized protein n=1 Tax=Ranatra chinensis TaxID=642074 RepID=A0ABD0Y3V8_9HEMI
MSECLQGIQSQKDGKLRVPISVSDVPSPHLVQLLGEWSETFPYDFRDERVMSHVREVAHRCVQVEGPVRQEVSLLLHNLLHRLTKLEQYEAFLHSIHAEAVTDSLEALSQQYDIPKVFVYRGPFQSRKGPICQAKISERTSPRANRRSSISSTLQGMLLQRCYSLVCENLSAPSLLFSCC